MLDEGRPEPRVSVDERGTLTDFLAWQRATLEWKLTGLPDQGWHQTLAPSTMTLAGMVKHLWFVEVFWAQEVFAGTGYPPPWDSVDWDADDDWDWHSAVDDPPDELVSAWKSSCLSSDEIYAAAELDQLAARRREGVEPVSLRWVLVHLIEEYARHNGHADLIRESIDGGAIGE